MAPLRSLVLSLLALAAFAHEPELDPSTPVPLTDGSVAPLSNCLFEDELASSLRSIKREMLSYGISRATSKAYCRTVERVHAVPAAANSTVVCFPPHALNAVGTELGEIILEYLHDRGVAGMPAKRGARGAPRGESINWGGDLSESGGPRKCCRCDAHTEYVVGSRANCPRGPCCPKLCLSLKALNGQSATEDSCCLRSHNKCLHQRNGDGGRSKGRFT